ncbi:GNAT family N-acetyltransferase [Cohnella phaseoli]|uniref:Phosphinothricin acetyltransferase n=1 Tax=Cohnella phaseoli TaxID=456490 RepID=A0A3D9JPV0_9BACL|nr:GNAT family N-acetyltransferase [Cohnella phaseoli]RED76054.1 phosphinothricin acetyltransferase [Cohnella phaseoli]
MEIRLVKPEDWEAIKTIYEEGILTGNATFQVEAPTKEQWYASQNLPNSLVAIDNGVVLGWAALSPVSARSVYSGVAEISVYFKLDTRGKGVGDKLLKEIIDLSERNGFWTLQAGIFPENTASIRLHKKHGFREVGRRVRMGKLKEVWRDVLLLERRSEMVGID